MHGGKSLRGPAHPNYKDGKYSKVLPQRLRGSYEEAINDADLLRLKSEIALSDVRRQDLMSQLDKGSHDDFIEQLNHIRRELKGAAFASDTATVRSLSKDLDTLMEEKRPDGSVWRDLIEIEDHKRKLVESERKRMVELGHLLTMEQSLFLLKRIAEIIKAAHSERRLTLPALSREALEDPDERARKFLM